jgi:acyl-CoA thioester hydrolase
MWQLRSPAGGLDKGPENPSIGVVDLEFGVPLDPEAEAVARVFDTLNDPILGDRVDDKAGPCLLDRLVMRAVDREVGGAGDAMQQRTGDYLDGMSRLVSRVRLTVRYAARDFVRDVLDQGAAEHDIQQLLAAADAEHRHPSGERALRRGEFESGPAVFGGDTRMAGRRAEQRGIDIEAAASDDEPVDPIEIGASGIGVVRQQDRQPTGPTDRIAIVFADRVPGKFRITARRLMIEGEADDRLCHAARSVKTEETMSEFYEQPLPIRTYDIDFAGIVSNIVFIRWLEDLRLALLDQAYPLIRALAEDVAPILLATRINYRRPVTIADPLVGRIRVAGLSRVRWRLAAEFTVTEVLHAEAEQEGLFMRLSTRRPIAIPEPIRRWHSG